jgi:hypothetical protein
MKKCMVSCTRNLQPEVIFQENHARYGYFLDAYHFKCQQGSALGGCKQCCVHPVHKFAGRAAVDDHGIQLQCRQLQNHPMQRGRPVRQLVPRQFAHYKRSSRQALRRTSHGVGRACRTRQNPGGLVLHGDLSQSRCDCRGHANASVFVWGARVSQCRPRVPGPVPKRTSHQSKRNPRNIGHSHDMAEHLRQRVVGQRCACATTSSCSWPVHAVVSPNSNMEPVGLGGGGYASSH